MKIKLVTFACIIGIIIIFPGCKFDKTGEDKSAPAEDILTLDDLEGEPEILEDILFLFPSPGEIVDGFFNSELEYKPGLVNSVENLDSYLGSRSQALNLGIYVADLAYLAKFEISGESVDYLEAVQSLSTQVGISTEIFESLLERAKANINNPDTILAISNEAFYKMFTFLETSKKESTLAIISTGAYIESLYLVLETKSEFAENDAVFEQITEMKYPFDNLLSRAREHKDDKNVESICKYLNAINQTFDSLSKEETETIVTRNEGQLTIGGGTKFILTEEYFNKLKSTIHSFRTEITSI
ncbi:MAG: hypothetical protein U9N53_13125 [Bacteroidota bacterium]|nr:hypothetical protein [Bacteroidota bacterium]